MKKIPKLVCLSNGPLGPIKQDDLLEERILYQKATRSVEAWQQKAREIREKIESGARVESGIYNAAVVEEDFETALGFKLPITRLVVS